MRIALIGSVSSSFYALDGLIRGGVDVCGVLGLDEKFADRVSDFRSLKPLAQSAGIAFAPFAKVTDASVPEFLSSVRPDQLWVIGLSQLVGEEIRKIAQHGAVGFHPTLLPEGRGRAPVAWTILLNARAAVNLFYLTDEPDAGDIVVQREVPVLPDDYSEDLIQRTNEVLRDVVIELSPRLKDGPIPGTPQDHNKATYFERRTPDDGAIDWSRSTDELYRLIRAAGRPYPGAFTHAGTQRIIAWRGQPSCKPASKKVVGDASNALTVPGAVLETGPDGITVKTGDGAMMLTETEAAEPAEGKMMNSVKVGTILGRPQGEC